MGDSRRRAGASKDQDARLAGREEAALEKRLWVRLTRVCNNRCAFCLDSLSLDGARISSREVNAKIIDGRREGASRLILSGGEPTLHPRFLEFVALGTKLGYRRVQTITNGRLFSYRGFLRRAVDAGLGEITFSIHGHEASVHDALVGVPGAFDEAMAGLKNALDDPRLIVNVDVCLNKLNIRGLPDLLDRCLEMGVREFDLLHIIPFGRAYEESGTSLFYDIEEAMPSISHALKLSEREDLHIWFNRFPPPYLEGFEHLIQDPHKLEDEVRGRREEFALLILEGHPLHCKQEDRCRHCYLEAFCDTFDRLLSALSQQEIRILRHDASHPLSHLESFPGSIDTSWVVAPSLEMALPPIRALPGDEIILELDSYAGLSDALESGLLLRKKICALYVRRPDDIDALLALRLDAEVIVRLNVETASHLLTHYPKAPSNMAVAGTNYGRMSEAKRSDADLAEFFSRWDFEAPVEAVPACISGRAPRPPPIVLDTDALGDGAIDPLGFARWYVGNGFFTKSGRCSSCVLDKSCSGAHINWVRAHGYRTLEPLAEPGPDQSIRMK